MLELAKIDGGKYNRAAVVLSLFDTGLAAIRALGRAGVPVLGLDSDPQMPGFKSRYCTAKVCPDAIAQPDELAQFLLTQGKRLGHRGILFPTSDAYVLFVSRYQEQLRQCFDVALPPAALVEGILNKRTQYDLAARQGVPFPATFYPQSQQGLVAIQNDIPYPACIKPYYAHLWGRYFDSKGVRVDSPQELVAAFEHIWPTGLQAMVQSVIPGPASSNYEISFYIGQQGDLLALFTVQKLRQYPPQFGVGTLVQSVHHPELFPLMRRLLDGLDYRGFGNLEFKLDPRDGQLKLIELNARLWQQSDQAAACGINFPLIQYLDLTGQFPCPQTDFPDGVRWVDPMADFQSFWHFYRKGEMSAWEWLQSWQSARAFAVFARDDWRPALASLDYGLKLLRVPLYAFRHRLPQE